MLRYDGLVPTRATFLKRTEANPGAHAESGSFEPLRHWNGFPPRLAICGSGDKQHEFKPAQPFVALPAGAGRTVCIKSDGAGRFRVGARRDSAGCRTIVRWIAQSTGGEASHSSSG